MKSKSGFTLVEVLVVVVIVSIIASIAVVAYDTQQKLARDNKVEIGAVELASALDNYYEEKGNYPVTCGHSAHSVLACGNLPNTYTSSMTMPPTITPSTSAASLRTILPGLSDSFSHPKAPSNNPLNQITSNNIKTDSYFLLSMDMVPGGTPEDSGGDDGGGTISPEPTCPKNSICLPPPETTNSGSVQLASITASQNSDVLGATTVVTSSSVSFVNPNGGNFTCNFALTGMNPAGTQDIRPHQYVIGFVSEETKSWKFYLQSPREDLNVLNWNTSNISSCNAQGFGELKSASLS